MQVGTHSLVHFIYSQGQSFKVLLLLQVVCEEMDWLPFYPVPSSAEHLFHGHNEPSTSLNLEAIIKALDQCSRWIGDFMKYSTWVQQPAGARARAFLSKR